jgi:hypothetical protein
VSYRTCDGANEIERWHTESFSQCVDAALDVRVCGARRKRRIHFVSRVHPRDRSLASDEVPPPADFSLVLHHTIAIESTHQHDNKNEGVYEFLERKFRERRGDWFKSL